MYQSSPASLLLLATVLIQSAVHATELSQQEYQTFTNGRSKAGGEELYERREGNPYMLVFVLKSCTIPIGERY